METIEGILSKENLDTITKKVLEQLIKEKVDSELAAQTIFELHCGLRKNKQNENGEYPLIDGYSKAYATDGFSKNALIEVKLNFQNKSYGLSKALIQGNDYPLMRLEANGEYRPAYFLAVDYKNETVNVYEYEKTNEVYKGKAENFKGVKYSWKLRTKPVEKFDWMKFPEKVRKYLFPKKATFLQYEIGEHNILGLAGKFYENKTVNKIDFFDNYLAQVDADKPFIANKDWGRKNIVKFCDILDKLNDPASQKVLGAFYTPEKYVKISTKYLMNAIAEVKKKGFGDYVIIDRCCGTGSLERLLDDETLSHCILNTYEAKEWVALTYKFYADNCSIAKENSKKYPELNMKKVRFIIPHEYAPDGTLLRGGNALTKDFLCNFTDISKRDDLRTLFTENETFKPIEDIFAKRDNGKLAIIMLENPPFKDLTFTGKNAGKADKGVQAKTNLKKDLIVNDLKGSSSNQISNLFINTRFKYFKPEHYIVYSPVSYWKNDSVCDKEFIEGYICDRQFFHAASSGLPLIHWGKNNVIYKELILDSDIGKRTIKKINKSIKELRQTPVENDYLAVIPFNVKVFGSMVENWAWADTVKKDTMRSFSTLTKENLLVENVLGVAAVFPIAYADYTENGILMKSADGGKMYQKDMEFLNDCLIYMLLTQKNKCSKNNEIYTYGFSILAENKKHKSLLNKWKEIYDITGIYGLNNVDKEFCAVDEDDNYIEDADDVATVQNLSRELKKLLKEFYIAEIRPKMLKYELVK